MGVLLACLLKEEVGERADDTHYKNENKQKDVRHLKPQSFTE
jgi:predicted HTH domain antitoxin